MQRWHITYTDISILDVDSLQSTEMFLMV